MLGGGIRATTLIFATAGVLALLLAGGGSGGTGKPAGRIVISGSLAVPQGLQVINADGTGRRELNPNTLYPDGNPDWSPDGRWIVFTRIVVEAKHVGPPSPARNGLFRIAASGGKPKLLFLEPRGTTAVITYAQWSPTGREIAFESQRTGRAEIWIYSLNGTLRQLTHDGGDHPSWSPDGKRIAYHGAHAPLEIINADGTGEHQLKKSAGTAYPIWSPDGKWIAVRGGNVDAVAQAGGPPSAEIDTLEIISASGTTRRRLFRGGGIVPSDWAPTSDAILYWHTPAVGDPNGTLFTIPLYVAGARPIPGLDRAGAGASWHR